MNTPERQQHWQTIYTTKAPHQVSWTQPVPTTSLDFLQSFGLNKEARIIDIGGGDSRLVDYLVAAGYRHVTVLDLSAAAFRTRAGPLRRAGQAGAMGGGRRPAVSARARRLRRVARPRHVSLLHHR